MTSTLRAALAGLALACLPAVAAAQLATLKAPVPVTEPDPEPVRQAGLEEPAAGPSLVEPGPQPRLAGDPLVPAPKPGPTHSPTPLGTLAPLTATVAPAPTPARPPMYSGPMSDVLCERPAGPWCQFAPYAWVFGVKGTVGAGVRTQSVDLSVRDAVTKVLPDLKGAAQVHVEAGYGDFGILADLSYLRVVPLDGLVKVESRSTLLELLGTYRLVGSGGGGAGTVTLDVLAGARYYRFTNSIELNPLDLDPAERSSSWVDAVVGARLGARVLDNLGLFARADVGGFGWGDSSRRATNVIAGFEYRCGENCSLYGGYRWFKIDRQAGTGRDAFLLDVTLSGPFVALGVKF